MMKRLARHKRYHFSPLGNDADLSLGLHPGTRRLHVGAADVEGNGTIGVLAVDNFDDLLSEPSVDVGDNVSTAIIVERDLVEEVEEVVGNDNRTEADLLLQRAGAAERKHFLHGGQEGQSLPEVLISNIRSIETYLYSTLLEAGDDGAEVDEMRRGVLLCGVRVVALAKDEAIAEVKINIAVFRGDDPLFQSGEVGAVEKAGAADDAEGRSRHVVEKDWKMNAERGIQSDQMDVID